MKQIEDPCVDGEPCSWEDEQEYLTDGRVVIDTYCTKCFRYRDWSKDEFQK